MSWIFVVIAGLLEIAWGSRPQAVVWFHATASHRPHARHGRAQPGAARACGEDAAAGRRVCGVDRDRRGRSGGLWRLRSGRIAHGRARGLSRPDSVRRRRAPAPWRTVTSRVGTKKIGRSCLRDGFSQLETSSINPRRAIRWRESLFLFLNDLLGGGLFRSGLLHGRLLGGGFLCSGLFGRRLLGGGFFCSSFLNGHEHSPLSHRGCGKCERLVNNSRCAVNNFSTRMRQRISRKRLDFFARNSSCVQRDSRISCARSAMSSTRHSRPRPS